MNDVVGRYDVQPEGALIFIALDTTFHYVCHYVCMQTLISIHASPPPKGKLECLGEPSLELRPQAMPS